MVNGVDLARRLRPESGVVASEVPISPGDELTLVVGYRSRGLDRWRYVPGTGVANLENFRLQMRTDFGEIDFPAGTLSPSKKSRDGEGWLLDWDFAQVITGRHMGMVMPQRVQPGEMASTLSFSAPVSLLFFFTMIFVLATLRGIDIHPINYLMLAGAFFAFHLLFGYLADHLPVVDMGDRLSANLAPKGLPLMVAAETLDSMVDTLLDNAFRHGGEQVKVELTTTSMSLPSGDQRVEIAVSDDGPGIDAAIAESLFQPFVTTAGD